MPADVTEDAVLGGRLRLRQPGRGHRVGHDAILLAAACPARAGDAVVDLGAGVGAAGLALAARVPGVIVTLVEIDPELAVLAEENARLNELSARVRTVEYGDAAELPFAESATGYAQLRQRLDQIAQRHGVAQQTAHGWLRAAGIPLRPAGQSARADPGHPALRPNDHGLALPET